MNKSLVKINGFIVPIDWDRHGNVTQVSILTDTFEKYIINEPYKGGHLLELLDQHVFAEGFLAGEDMTGNKIFNVKRFHLIDE